MEQPMFSLASYHGERKRICNTMTSLCTAYTGPLKKQNSWHQPLQDHRTFAVAAVYCDQHRRKTPTSRAE